MSSRKSKSPRQLDGARITTFAACFCCPAVVKVFQRCVTALPATTSDALKRHVPWAEAGGTMPDQQPKTYRVEIRTMGGATLGDWEPTWTIFQFDVELEDIPELVACALSVDETADMEVMDDIAQPCVSLWKGYASEFDLGLLATA